MQRSRAPQGSGGPSDRAFSWIRSRRIAIGGGLGAGGIAVLLVLPVASASLYVDSSPWLSAWTTNTPTPTCGHDASSITQISTTTGIGSELAYSSQSNGPCSTGFTTQVDIIGVYGNAILWTFATGTYALYVNWSVSYNISESISEPAHQSCASGAVSSTYFYVKTNFYDNSNSTNEWPNGQTLLVNNPSVTCTNNYPSFSQSNSQGTVSLGTPIYLVQHHTYSVWSYIELESLAASKQSGEKVYADIDMQSSSLYGEILAFTLG